MKPKESLADRLAREAAQAIVRHEILGWPPDSPWGTYQPHRPEAPLPQPKDKKKTDPPAFPRARRFCGGRSLLCPSVFSNTPYHRIAGSSIICPSTPASKSAFETTLNWSR